MSHAAGGAFHYHFGQRPQRGLQPHHRPVLTIGLLLALAALAALAWSVRGGIDERVQVPEPATAVPPPMAAPAVQNAAHDALADPPRLAETTAAADAAVALSQAPAAAEAAPSRQPASALAAEANAAVAAQQSPGAEAVPLTAAEAALPAAEGQTAAAAAVSLRSLDLSQLPPLLELARSTGGRVDATAALFADLTGDGAEEAVVPITSDGSYGNLAFAVLTAGRGSVEALLVRRAGGASANGVTFSLDGDRLVERVGIYAPEDPLCCPSRVQTTYFAWDGTALTVEHVETVEQPSGKQ